MDGGQRPVLGWVGGRWKGRGEKEREGEMVREGEKEEHTDDREATGFGGCIVWCRGRFGTLSSRHANARKNAKNNPKSGGICFRVCKNLPVFDKIWFSVPCFLQE